MEQILSEHGTEEDLEKAVETALEQCRECEEQVAALARQLPSEEDDPLRAEARLRATLKSLDEDITSALLTRERLQQQLEAVAEKGAYDEFARIEEALRITQDQYDGQIRRAKAIKLLKALCDARQKSVFDQLTTPISARVTRYFEQVTGEIGRRIQFDQSLRPAAMAVERTHGLSTDALSTGAREQLHVLARLALGRYLATTYGRMLFVLDDSLVNTDAARRRKFLDLLVEAQEDLQVVLLTCHPDLYRGLEGAHRLALA